MSGRHAAPVGRNFYRDLATMVGGIIVVAMVVYGLLWFFAGRDNTPSPTTQVAQPVTSVTDSVTTTREVVSTPTSVTTTEVPTTTGITLRAPAEVRVLVLNAVGVAGLAAEVTEDLQGFG
ncbi:MAG: LytR C-terminal domain-containing protein, partial [Acidimicrobiia bacterium]